MLGSYSRYNLESGFEKPFEQVKVLYEDHLVLEYGLTRNQAKHLFHFYGTRSLQVIDSVKSRKDFKSYLEKVHPEFDYLKAEVVYACHSEMAEKVNDIICRRIPIAFVNKQAAQQTIKQVAEIMKKEKNWSSSQTQAEIKSAEENIQFLK